MLHSRRNLFNIGGGIFRVLASQRLAMAMRRTSTPESRRALEKLAQTYRKNAAPGGSGSHTEDPPGKRLAARSRVAGA
jgi:hypothetical protein